MKWNKLLALGLSAMIVLSLTACGNANADNPNLQPPSPFTDYETLTDAAEGVGFEISVPDSMQGFDKCVYRADKEGGMLEVIFQNDDEEIRIRKAVGDGDISGNYNEFSEKDEVDVDGTTVTMKGSENKVNVATWSKDGYAYSIDSTAGLDKTQMTDLFKVVNDDMGAAIGGDPATWGPAEDGAPLAPPSPFIDCDSLEAAAELAGFDVRLPETPDTVQAWEGHMIQAFYGEDGNDMLIRKAVGDGDISGDYNVYAQMETVDGVTLKGEKDAFFLAVWEQDGYTYSVSVSGALSQADFLALVAAVQ